MMYPLVSELAADGIPITRSCRVLGFSPQAFYKWQSQPVTDRDWDDAALVNKIIDIHADDPTFGYRFIHDELDRAGVTASENRVQRLCTQHRVWSAHSKRRGKARRPGPPVHDDLVKRNFSTTGPNKLWLTDITEHRTGEGKLYLCAVKDVWSNRIVGYSMSDRMTAELAERALKYAIAARCSKGTVIHSDRGSQFRSNKFVKTIAAGGLTGSMGRVGAAGDNAAMESFFSLLQKNVLDTRARSTRAELRAAITAWIETDYHRRRRQRSRGRLTPVEYETINAQVVQIAA